ncbi:hypothetical protein HZA39_01970 [Candidatus Peregrinibacteria bacterium]|nr:hypothetical protein [Candidatus Peregrinibacteria bacterium]
MLNFGDYLRGGLIKKQNPNNLTEAKIATKTAQVLLEEIKKKIQSLNPQQALWQI